VARDQRDGDRDGSLVRRATRGRERPRFRSRALRAVAARRVARPRDRRRLRAGLDLQAHHGSRGAREREGHDREPLPHPRPDHGRRSHDPQRRGRLHARHRRERVDGRRRRVLAQRRRGRDRPRDRIARDVGRDRALRLRQADRGRAGRREPGDRPAARQLERLVVGDDRLRPGDLGRAVGDGARLLRDRERWAVAAPADRPRAREHQRRHALQLRPGDRRARDLGAHRGDAARLPARGRRARDRQPDRPRPRLDDGREDGDGADRRARRVRARRLRQLVHRDDPGRGATLRDPGEDRPPARRLLRRDGRRPGLRRAGIMPAATPTRLVRHAPAAKQRR